MKICDCPFFSSSNKSTMLEGSPTNNSDAGSTTPTILQILTLRARKLRRRVLVFFSGTNSKTATRRLDWVWVWVGAFGRSDPLGGLSSSHLTHLTPGVSAEAAAHFKAQSQILYEKPRVALVLEDRPRSGAGELEEEKSTCRWNRRWDPH